MPRLQCLVMCLILAIFGSIPPWIVPSANNASISLAVNPVSSWPFLSSTMIDFTTFRVQRAGACFESIAKVMREEFGVELKRPAQREDAPQGAGG